LKNQTFFKKRSLSVSLCVCVCVFSLKQKEWYCHAQRARSVTCTECALIGKSVRRLLFRGFLKFEKKMFRVLTFMDLSLCDAYV
jgi:hypothetical protein